MPKFTLIFRLEPSPALPLAASMDDDKDAATLGGSKDPLEEYKKQAKQIMRQIGPSSPPRCTITSGTFSFHCLTVDNVCFLTLAEKSFDKRLAYHYLEELQKEFLSLYSGQIDAVKRPYYFIGFDTFIQKTKKVYLDTRAGRNLKMLNEELRETIGIAQKTVEEVLGRGEKIADVSQKSSQLSEDSKRFKDRTKHLNTMVLLQRYAPMVIGGLVILLLFYLLARRLF
mmetsp:Transcript_34645/g.79011  ORF Transcript_34645/g.79011 Transcript_34645/m.79011 type:complete len:227 (-) Transcript_34645:206-886(-)